VNHPGSWRFLPIGHAVIGALAIVMAHLVWRRLFRGTDIAHLGSAR